MFKRFMPIVISIVLLVTASVIVVHAENMSEGIAPRYSYANIVRTNLTVSGGQAKCQSTIVGYETVTKINVSMTLEKKTLLWWTAQESWTQTYNNVDDANFIKYCNVNGGTYRVKSVYTVYSGSDSETITDYSNEVKV